MMKYKILFFIVLLMFVVLTGILLYKGSGLLYNIENQLVNYLEDYYQIEIKVAESSFWPINQMILKNAEIKSTENKFSISVPEISIYYDFFAFLSTKRNPGNAIDFISLNKPYIEVNDTNRLNGNMDSIQYSDLDENTIKKSIFEVLNRLYATAPFQIKVDDGDLVYNSSNKMHFGRLNLLLKVVSEDECNIKLDTTAYTDKLVWDKYELNELTFKDLKLVMSVNKDSWQGSLETDFISLPDISEFIAEKEDALIRYSDLKGLIKSKLLFSGKGLSLNEYTGIFSLKNGQGDFTIEIPKGETPITSNYSLNPKFNIQDVEGDIIYNSSTDIISSEDIEFKMNQNQFRFNGRAELLSNDDIDIFGHLRTNQLDLTGFNVLPDNLNIEGLMVMDYTVTGLLSNLNMNLDLSLLDGEVNNQKIENMVSNLRYYKGDIYLDQLNFVLNETNQLSMNGIIDNNKGYSFEIEGRDIDLSILNQSSYFLESFADEFSDITGLVNLRADLTAEDLKLENLNAAGQIEIVEPALYLSKIEEGEVDIEQKIEFSRFISEFYLAEEKVFFHQGMATGDWGELAISGELGIKDQDLDLKIDSEYLNLGKFLAYTGNEKLKQTVSRDIAGGLSLDGVIEGKINSPVLKADIFSKGGSLKGYRYNDFTANIYYNNKKIAINNLKLNYQEAVIAGQALLDLTSTQPTFNGDFTTEDFSYELMNNILREENITEQVFPVNGNIDLILSFEGPLTKPNIVIQANSSETNIVFNDREISVDLLELVMSGGVEGFSLDKLNLSRGEASIIADGIVSQKILDIGYKVNNLSLQYILEELDYNQVDGLINVLGSINGTLDKPLVKGEISITDLKDQQNSLGDLKGMLLYSVDKLKIDSIIWKNTQGEYIINGDIDNIQVQPTLNLKLNTGKGYLQDFAFLNLNEEFERFALDNYNFIGEALVKGPINEIYTWLDFTMINNDNSNDTIKILGGIGPQIDLSIIGNGVTIDKFLSKYTDMNIDGEVEFSGEITGKIDSFELHLDSKMNNIVLGEVPVEAVQGKIEVSEGAILNIDQKLSFSSDSSMDITGSFPFEEGLDGLNLSLDLRRFPLQLLSVYSNHIWGDVSGVISGDVELNGGLDHPVLAGELNINNGGLDVKIADRFTNLMGDLILDGRQIKLRGISGKYGEGDFLITGLLEPFDENENIELALRGENLPFDYGSFKGQFNPDMIITGSFKEPFIKADLLTHDLNIRMPFEWPASNDDENNLKFDLTLYPGEDVYLLNKNINVLVQDGSLNINNLGDQLVFSGELTSKQGVFDFYNNRFIMEEGSAIFERSFDESKTYIPKVNVSAWTNVGGGRVEVMLTGKANSMVTTFSSSPPLTQDEILTLLTSRGGIGEFASGDLGNVVQSELYRMLYNQLQLDIVKDIQEKIKSIFSLDRLEVDVYNLGWDDQLSIYVGKNLNKRLYLEYTDVIITDDDLMSDNKGELSLQYMLNDKVTIESSWQGEDNYSLSLETNFEF